MDHDALDASLAAAIEQLGGERRGRRGKREKPRSAAPWLAEIDAALSREEEEWRRRGRKVVQRYRDERDSGSELSRVNILWSNTEVLRAALYARTPKPDVRRRFLDARGGDQAGRAASEIIERAVAYCIEAYDFDAAIEAAIEDMLLPGRGIAFVSYEPEIEEEGPFDPPENEGDENEASGQDGEAGEGDLGGDQEEGAQESEAIESAGEDGGEEESQARLGRQKLSVDHVYWEDFCHGLARSWRDVPWVARRHALRREEFEGKFPDAKAEINLGYELRSANEGGQSTSANDRFVEVWEVWSKQGRERLFLARGYENVLQADPDPLKLENFFPCPEPLYAVTTTDRAEPVPEFAQYQDQASELDAISTRINRLVEQMRWRGIYDATVDQDGATLKALEHADDGTLLPHDNFQMLREKGGIEGAIGFVPIERLYPIVAQLQAQRQRLMQEIYEITGISDIIRGSTNPNETKGAQVLKAQFGSMRMQKRQGKVQRFIRDLYRLQAEIIAEHFTIDSLREMTGIDLPTAEEQQRLKAVLAGAALAPGFAPGLAPAIPSPLAPPPPSLASAPSPSLLSLPSPSLPPELIKRAHGANWDEVIALLESDRLRGYRVDIETDATMMVDAEAEKQSRLEFMNAMKELLSEAYAAMSAAPQMLPVLKELFLFGVRSFKPGRVLEETFETALDELAKSPPPTIGAGAGGAGGQMVAGPKGAASQNSMGGLAGR